MVGTVFHEIELGTRCRRPTLSTLFTYRRIERKMDRSGGKGTQVCCALLTRASLLMKYPTPLRPSISTAPQHLGLGLTGPIEVSHCPLGWWCPCVLQRTVTWASGRGFLRFGKCPRPSATISAEGLQILPLGCAIGTPLQRGRSKFSFCCIRLWE